MPQRGEKRGAKGGSKDKKRGRCLESKDALLSFERRETGLKECVGSCIYICDIFFDNVKTVYSTRLFFFCLPPMTRIPDVNREVKRGTDGGEMHHRSCEAH